MPVNGINDWVDVAIIFLVVLIGLLAWLTGTALVIWFERRVISFMQYRIGPTQVGPFGIGQSFADGIKFFFKEDIEPAGIDKRTYYLAPLISAVTGMSFYAVVPFGGTVEWFGREVTLQIWDPAVGMLIPLAWSGIAIYGIVLAGWSSNSKYALLGSVRASAQMVAYELGFGLSIAALFIWVGSMRISDIVAVQNQPLFPQVGFLSWLPAWNVFPMFPAFILFFAAGLAETSRPPFDLPEAEGELVAGFHTEYSAAKFAMFYLAEFMNMITMGAFTVTLFFGGPNGPLTGIDFIDGWLPTIYYFLKLIVFLYIFVAFRGSMPRFRYPHLMNLGWRVFLPVGMAWVFLTGIVVTMRNQAATLGGTSMLDVLPYIGGGVVFIGLLALIATYLNPPPLQDDPNEEVTAETLRRNIAYGEPEAGYESIYVYDDVRLVDSAIINVHHDQLVDAAESQNTSKEGQ